MTISRLILTSVKQEKNLIGKVYFLNFNPNSAKKTPNMLKTRFVN